MRIAPPAVNHRSVAASSAYLCTISWLYVEVGEVNSMQYIYTWFSKPALVVGSYLWSAKTRIGPLFSGWMSQEATKPGFSLCVCVCLFCVVVHFFWLVNVCSCCYVYFFHTKPRDWLGERLWNDLFKTLTQVSWSGEGQNPLKRKGNWMNVVHKTGHVLPSSLWCLIGCLFAPKCTPPQSIMLFDDHQTVTDAKTSVQIDSPFTWDRESRWKQLFSGFCTAKYYHDSKNL